MSTHSRSARETVHHADPAGTLPFRLHRRYMAIHWVRSAKVRLSDKPGKATDNAFPILRTMHMAQSAVAGPCWGGMRCAKQLNKLTSQASQCKSGTKLSWNSWNHLVDPKLVFGTKDQTCKRSMMLNEALMHSCESPPNISNEQSTVLRHRPFET